MLGPDCLGLVEQWLEGRKVGCTGLDRGEGSSSSPLGQGTQSQVRRQPIPPPWG